MNVRLPRQHLQEALAATSTLTSGRTTKPILNCVRLTVAGEVLNLRATDGEAALCVQVPTIQTKRDGDTVVTADRLFNIVREMPDIEIQFESTAQQAVIRGEGSEFKIYVHDPADYPPVPDFEGDPDLVLDGHGLRRAIARTLYAAAKETTRYAINGVLWQKRGKSLFLVATDGRRLARASCPVSKAQASDFEVIIPAKALSVFERVCIPPQGSDDPWSVDVRVMPNQILLRSGTSVMATALVEGRFPDYENVVPKDADKTARLDRTAFHSAIKRAALLTTEESRAVRLEFTSKLLTIRSKAPEQGEAKIELPVEFDGKPIEIGFNPGYLSDPLRAIDFDQILFKLSESAKPGILRGEDANEFLYVVMPVAL